MSNAELDEKVIALDRNRELKTKYGITFTAFADIEQTPHKQYLVGNFLGAGELSCMFGPPGSAKSVLAGDLAAHGAWGQPWFGRRVMQGGVLFVAAERAALVKRRLAGFRLYYGLADLPLAILSGSIDLRSNRTGADGIIACAKRWQDDDGIETRLIVGDTVSRLLAGGDENSPKDVGAFINNVAHIQVATGAHILLVHHVPHEQNRMRGHGALLAACDTTIRIEKNGSIRTATIEKNNDGEEGAQIAFNLESFELGKDPETDEPTTAPIVRPAEAPSPATRQPKLTKNQQTMFAILHDAGERGLPTEEWNERIRDAGIGVRRRADLTDIRSALLDKRLIRQTANGWAVNHR
jgi:AAA domain-containing protein